MNELVTSAFGFALDLAVKATFLFALTLAAVALLRRSGAAARHFAGTAGLVGRPRPAASGRGAAARGRFRSCDPRSPRWRPPRRPREGLALPACRGETFSRRENGALEKVSRQSRSARAGAKRRFFRVSARFPLPRAGVSVARPVPLPSRWPCWTAAALLVAARLALGLLRVRRIAPRRRAASRRGLEATTLRTCPAARSRPPRRAFESARVPVAMTSGLSPPLLLLCRQARLWEVERRRVVLLHELAHVRRGDWLWLLLAETAVALYWWHPLAWVLERQVRRDCETRLRRSRPGGRHETLRVRRAPARHLPLAFCRGASGRARGRVGAHLAFRGAPALDSRSRSAAAGHAARKGRPLRRGASSPPRP